MSQGTNDKAGRGRKLKEAYIDPARLDTLAFAWMETLKPYTRHPFEARRLGSTPALLVIDMQRFFLDEASGASLPAGRAILPRVKALLQAFRSLGLPVFFTRHVDRPGDREAPMYRWWNYAMEPGNPMTDLHPELVCGPGEVLTTKNQYSAFFGTPLEVLLKERSVTSLVVTGGLTHLCCESTARDAFMRGFDVIAVVDGMATLNESLHLSSLRGLVHGFVTPALSKEVVCGLGL